MPIDYTGTYSLAGGPAAVTLVVQQVGPEVAGAVEGGGASFKLSGLLQADGSVAGLGADDAGARLFFQARRQPAGVVLELITADAFGQPVLSDRRTLVFTAAAAPGPAASSAAASEAPTLEYQHPSGASFSYPEGWLLQEKGGGVHLIPPDRRLNDFGPAEVYVFTVLPVRGPGDAADPGAEVILQQIAKLAPFLTQSDAPRPFEIPAGKAVALGYAGRNPRSGLEIHAFALATTTRGQAAILLGFGEQSLVDRRLAQCVEVFSSLRWGEPQRDRRPA